MANSSGPPCCLPLRLNHAGARIVTDEAGRRVSVPADVKRIVSLAPNLTETVYALGLGDRLAGDTNYCDTPPAAKTKPHVGEPQNPSLEAIVALRPDLVLATTSINREETVDALSRLGVAVYTSDPHTVQGMLDSLAHMADVMGATAQGASLVSDLQARLDALHARLEDRPMMHVLFVVWQEPLITVGQNTFIADALRYAGAESAVIAKQNWPQIGLEEVVRLQPDYILFADNHEGSVAEHLSDLRARNDLKRSRCGAAWACDYAERRDDASFAGPGRFDRASRARNSSRGIPGEIRASS